MATLLFIQFMAMYLVPDETVEVAIQKGRIDFIISKVIVCEPDQSDDFVGVRDEDAESFQPKIFGVGVVLGADEMQGNTPPPPPGCEQTVCASCVPVPVPSSHPMGPYVTRGRVLNAEGLPEIRSVVVIQCFSFLLSSRLIFLFFFLYNHML